MICSHGKNILLLGIKTCVLRCGSLEWSLHITEIGGKEVELWFKMPQPPVFLTEFSKFFLNRCFFICSSPLKSFPEALNYHFSIFLPILV